MEDFEKFYNSSLRFLSYRPRSEKEVRDKLTTSRISRKKVEEVDYKVIDLVIEKLKEQKFINDEEFAKWWIESRIRFKPRSLRLIKIELRQKGISEEFVDKMIYDLRFKNYDLERAKDLVRKKLVRYKQLRKQEVYQKLGSYLARRGFDWDTIKQSIDESLFKGV